MAARDYSFILSKSSRGMVIALVVEFVLGTLVNSFAVPPDDPKYVTESLLVKLLFPVHGVLGIVLVVMAIIVLYLAVKSGKEKLKQLSIWGIISIVVAAGAGIATITLKDNASEIASFVMALGFLFAFASYGKLHLLIKQG